MARLRLQGQPGAMACAVTDVPAFPGERFTLGYPEAVGDAAGPYWFGSIKPAWEERDDGVWISKGEQPGQVSYVMTLTPSEDAVTAHFRLTNHSATGSGLLATVSQPGLFLFQNREYSCIHSGAGFGELEPGQTAEAVNRTYFVEAPLADWRRRMCEEFGRADDR